MKVLLHLDPVVLERALVSRVKAAHGRGLDARTLVLVPTARLADHVLRRLAQDRDAWLGLEVLTLRGLAWRILDGGAAARPARVASPRLREALLGRLLAARAEGFWSQFVERRRGAIGRLLRALDDLREAAIDPAALAATAPDEAPARDLVELYRRYGAVLDADAPGPRTVDDAGLLRAAVVGAREHARRYGAVFLHGAYEWIGVHLDLIRELDRGTSVTAFVPGAHAAPAGAYAAEFVGRFLLRGKAKAETLPDALPIEQRFDLSALYDEERAGRPVPASRVGLRHAQGEAAEVRVAVREALRAILDGTPPREIAIVARSLEPYAAALEEALDDEGIPWTSSLGSPLRRHPVVRDFLLLLEVLTEDFPRDATAELLRSPRLRWSAIAPDGERPAGERADVWSRKARILGGLDEWTRDLEAWAAAARGREETAEDVARRVGTARRIGRTLAALRDRARPATRSFGEHAGELRRWFDAWFDAPDDAAPSAAVAGVHELLDEMAELESFAGDRRRVGLAEARAWLETAIDGHELALRREDTGGIRVLDAMQARGLTFARVHLLGMNSGRFPRIGRDDPVLDDAWRERIVERTGRPLAREGRAPLEERLLLALTLGSAVERIDISWQRSDEAGRAKTASLALREVARVALGRPTLELFEASASPLVRHYHSHPRSTLETLLAWTGMLAPTEALVLAALGAGDAGDLDALARREPTFAPALEMLRATQAWDVVDPRYDGRIGTAPERSLSVSELGTLGRCPLQFFFERVLRVGELDAPASALAIAPYELGNEIHAVLQRIYERLMAEKRFEPARRDTLVARSLELLEAERPRLLGPLGPKLERRLPVLHARLVAAWTQALRRFLEHDLASMVEAGRVPVGLEHAFEGRIDLGAGIEQPVHGKFDRLLEDDGGRLVVGDYKTQGNLKEQVNLLCMLRGTRLQAPLYHLLSGGAKVELLGVGPQFDETASHEFSGCDNDEQREGLLESVRVLVALERAGRFPMRSGKHCDWCRYEAACRRRHPPTVARERRVFQDSADYHDLSQKVRAKPTLARVRAGRRTADAAGDDDAATEARP